MLNILSRWKRSRSFAAPLPTGSAPTQPLLSQHQQQRMPDSLLQSLLRWLPGESTPWGARAEDPGLLPLLRSEFRLCLADIAAPDELVQSIRRARRVDDFWHLRGWLYTEVARAHTQREAELRLARLNRHFSEPADTFFMAAPNRRQ
ncbi:hypothetical protein G8A07_13035 [Roseateles sp. DAIF2]|uniref:hypothetical protein n=1 Tax=Roseateles sp. DAIF2 TaxID=2714952 RepID=UPI0018A2BF3C|nr:hypothetical protein [Roseateles sp. DAIF2]QPF73757.1 hypothetical protein G8A07_13035 [Roseateles sp. DAIF2]